jgi:hypothetical protein
MTRYMTVTITDTEDGFLQIGCKDRRFEAVWGHEYRVTQKGLYQCMQDLTVWASRTLGEVLMFKIGG